MRRVANSIWLSGLVSFAALFLVSGAWSIATPLSASPDEPSHIIKAAAVVRGELVGKPLPQSGYTEVRVPSAEGDAWLWTCFAFYPNKSASCQGTPPGSSAIVTAKTSAGLYNPVYYALVGWPSLLFSEPHAVVFSMRLLTALLCSALLAVAVAALFAFRRSAVAGAAALAIATPTTMFLSGSVNPNAVEIAAGAALLALLLLLVRGPELQRRRTVLVLIAVTGVLLANTRALSPLWMLLIVIIALVAADPERLRELFRRPAVWVTIGVVGIGVIASVLWTMRVGVLSGFGHFPGQDVSPSGAFIAMILDRSFDRGMIGLFGWLDTPAPPFVIAFGTLLAMGTAVAALIVARGRLLAAVLVAVAGYLLVPAVTQALSIRQSGYIWQGRYSLIAYACVLVISAVAIAGPASQPGARPGPARAGVIVPRHLLLRGVITLGGLAALAQTLSIAGALRRYAVGEAGTWSYFILAPQWQAPGSNILWIVVALAGSGLFVWLWAARVAAETVSPRTPDTSESTDSPEYRAEAR
ncbi:DUF2142 domain-containing protein [Leifsonia poae]|uniref:DUF2142 domain-containing protein n=1 Tax=Leifsonia poae TaxID=110933 RepID=A0A9W6H8U6_9MICO|nr:DUF2142 domain-containing protein [Leifsonia poae]GLJ75564.1 hypothetical protein GCM10017584_11380 [Leifsonia poae]